MKKTLSLDHSPYALCGRKKKFIYQLRIIEL